MISFWSSGPPNDSLNEVKCFGRNGLLCLDSFCDILLSLLECRCCVEWWASTMAPDYVGRHKKFRPSDLLVFLGILT